MYLIVIIVALFIWAYQSYASRKHMRDAVVNIPGPYALPILGCVQLMVNAYRKNVLDLCRDLTREHGSLYRLFVFNRLLIFSGDAEFNEQLLASTTHITKHRMYSIMKPWMGGGILLSDGDKWRSRRRIITPTLHYKVLEDFLQVFDSQASVLVDCLDEMADGRTAFNIHTYISSFTLDVIAEAAMGTKVNAQTEKNVDYISAIEELTDILGWRLFRVHLHSELLFALVHPHKKWRQGKLASITHVFTTKVIEKRRKNLENSLRKGPSVLEDHDDIGSKKHSAFLDHLLQSTVNGKPLSDEDIREEVDTIMAGGYDTTASALSFALYLLARHPQVQNKILAEIQQVYGGSVQPISFTLMNLNELKYMECVIKETLRLYPSAPVIAREIKEDFKYKHSRLGNGVIPAGSEVVISILDQNRDSNQHMNPDDFHPERYENIDANFSSIPFSAGPRNCMGQKFAMLEMKIALKRILQKYELLHLGEDVQPIMKVVLGSENGMQLGIRRRHP